MLGEGLAAPIWPRSSGAVPLPQATAAADGTLTLQVPTQDPASTRDPSRLKLPRPGIYPVQVELRETNGGDTVDRFTTHLLAVEAPSDGSHLGAAVILNLSAPPSTGLDGPPTGPPAGASALADAAAGLSATPQVPLTVAPTPEVLESLLASAPNTAAALRDGLVGRAVLGRPFVPIDIPGLGAAAGPLLAQQLIAGRQAARAVLGRDPIDGIWLADEPLDGPALAQVVTAGVSRLVLPQGALGPSGPAVPAPLLPVSVTGDGAGTSATALVADATLSSRLDGRGAPLDQPLVAHQLLTDLAAVATLPADQGAPAPEGPLDRRVATVLAARGFIPTSGFLAELQGGLAASPVIRAVDLDTAFAVAVAPEPVTPAARSTSSSRSQRGTTTTAPVPTLRTLLPLPADAPNRGIGDVASDAIWQLATAGQVLANPAPSEGASPGPGPSGPTERDKQGPSGPTERDKQNPSSTTVDTRDPSPSSTERDKPGPSSTTADNQSPSTSPTERDRPGPGSSPAERDKQAPKAAELQRRLLVATSADLPVEQRRARLRALGDGARADLAGLKVPENRSLRLTARTGLLPVGIFNDTGRTARVLLQLDSEKLDFPAGNRVPVVLDRRTTTSNIRVRVRASGSFRVKVRLLTPDGGRVLQETEYVVRANTIPGVAIAVSGAAAVFLAGWWAKTLVPGRRHGRHRRQHRRRHRPTT